MNQFLGLGVVGICTLLRGNSLLTEMKSILFLFAMFEGIVLYSQSKEIRSDPFKDSNDVIIINENFWREDPLDYIILGDKLDNDFTGDRNIIFPKYNTEDNLDTIRLKLEYKDGIMIHAIGNYSNGQLLGIGEFDKRGFPIKSLTYFENGVIQSSYFGQDGKSLSPQVEYYSNGKLMSIRTWNSVQEYIELNENGVITGKATTYLDGHSENYMFFDNGNLKCKYVGNKGVQDYELYHENGELALKGKIFNSILEKVGTWTSYFENGVVKDEMFYDEIVPNKKIGIWKHYNILGELVNKEDYSIK